jgi:imidazolonepropionase-like amidohydrolase
MPYATNIQRKTNMLFIICGDKCSLFYLAVLFVFCYPMLYRPYCLSLIVVLLFLATAKLTAQTVYAVKNVNIITMTPGSTVSNNVTIVIQGNKIASINGAVPANATVIDGTSKWLIPGLADMHVHIPVDGHFNNTHTTRAAAIFTNTQDVMTPFIVNGVTTVLELNARAGHFGQRNEILRGDVTGPRMAMAAMINGGTGDGRIANTADEGRQSVRMAKAEGYEFIKVYSQLNAATYNAILDDSRAYPQCLQR